MRKYDTAERRWEGVGPYYAMFPTAFADEVVGRYTSPGDLVLDPFAGRGTTVFSAAWQGRHGIGVEINPVGWVYAASKLRPASEESVARRLREIGESARDYCAGSDALPEFFHVCFSKAVLAFLACAREVLDWRESDVDRTLMATLLIYMHGKWGAALSNQMRQTKAMAPDYAVRWWKEREMSPPEVDPVEFLAARIRWRYAKGVPNVMPSEMYLGNSEEYLSQICHEVRRQRKTVRLLFTSPPYFGLANYHYDQWLRLWLLGGQPTARRQPGFQDIKGRFENAERYTSLLRNVFSAAGETVAKRSTIYVRTGAAARTFTTTFDVLREVFPRHSIERIAQPYSRPTQTRLFGDKGRKPGEIDLVLRRA